MSNRHPKLDRMTVKDFLVAYGRPPDSITVGEMLEIYRAQALILKARANQTEGDEEEADPISVIDLSEHAGGLFESLEREAHEELGVPMPEIERQLHALRESSHLPESTEALAKRFGIPAINLSSFEINEAAIALVPREICEKYHLIPMHFFRSILIVAMADPSNLSASDDLQFITGYSIEVVVASEEDIARAIARYYP